jgi:hypothetical protein
MSFARNRMILPRIVTIMLLSAAIVPVFPIIAAAQGAASTRVTTSFDVKHAGAVLKKVSKLFSAGFGREQTEQLTRAINEMKAEVPMSWEFQVIYQGSSYSLQVRALLDDLGMVDLDFATAPQLAPAVRAAVDGYLNGLNL